MKTRAADYASSMNPEEHYRRLERAYAVAATNRYYQPVLRISEGKAELTIPVRSDFFHAAGAVHGSVYFKALDDSAFFAANSLVFDVFVLTASFNLWFTRPVSEGEVRATGVVVHRSANLIVADSLARDSSGRQVARGTGSFMRSRIPLGPEIGY
ncbi:MAG TPA: PaaI family thioesterase [Thermoanaerobaculia bacterium]|nr:PaaI family thioesterase [Thermoanaerobaculia bacterium]